MNEIILNDRAVIAVTGPDAEHFLQNLVTTNLDDLSVGHARAGALLTPQGKILLDFVISRRGEGGFLLETDRELKNDLVKRLTLYKLRASVTIAADELVHVFVSSDDAAQGPGLRDERFRTGQTVRRHYRASPDIAGDTPRQDYDRLRIINGVAECPADFAASDVFPHDVLYDLNGGVSFRKGCFVGQEVVSRMQHRGSARRRTLVAVSDGAPIPSGAALLAGEKTIGTTGTAVETRALVIARTDRVSDALASDTALTIGNTAVTLAFPAWTGLSLQPGLASGTDQRAGEQA